MGSDIVDALRAIQTSTRETHQSIDYGIHASLKRADVFDRIEARLARAVFWLNVIAIMMFFHWGFDKLVENNFINLWTHVTGVVK